jgi:hypothetical protein
MTNISKAVSLISLGFVLVPCMLFFAGGMELETTKLLALIGTFAWFVATPMWMSRKLPIDASEVEI